MLGVTLHKQIIVS